MLLGAIPTVRWEPAFSGPTSIIESSPSVVGVGRHPDRMTSPDQHDALRMRASARLKAIWQEGEAKYRLHPWPFLRDAVWTLDQASGQIRRYPGEPTEPMPSCGCGAGGCVSYYHHLVNRWHTTQRLLVPKSRRLMVSWTMLACHYWLARYRPHSLVGIAARKQGRTDSEGSNELVKRIWFVHSHLPATVAPIAVEYGVGRIKFPDSLSEIVAVAQGEDQARQYTYSAFFADEMAFWEEAQSTYVALLPTLEGGGKFTAVSSAAPGFFKQLVFDELGRAT